MIIEHFNNTTPDEVLAREASLAQLEYNGLVTSYFNSSYAILGGAVTYDYYNEANTLGAPCFRSFVQSAPIYIDSNSVYISIVSDAFTDLYDFRAKMETYLTGLATQFGISNFSLSKCGLQVENNTIAVYGFTRGDDQVKSCCNLVIYEELLSSEVYDVFFPSKFTVCGPPDAGLKNIGVNLNRGQVKNAITDSIISGLNLDDGVTDEDMTLYQSTSEYFKSIINTEHWLKYGQPEV